MGGETQGLRSYHWTDAAGMGYFLTEECSIKMHQHILEQLNEQRWSPDRRLHCAGKEQSTPIHASWARLSAAERGVQGARHICPLAHLHEVQGQANLQGWKSGQWQAM